MAEVKLRGIAPRSFEMRGQQCKSYSSKNIHVLAVSDSIELVDAPPSPELASLTQIKKKYGEPMRTIVTPGGSFLVYRGFGVDVTATAVYRSVYFDFEKEFNRRGR